MNTINEVVNLATSEAAANVTTKGKRNTIPKLSPSEASMFPGVNTPVVKKVESEFTYSILFCLPVNGQIGTKAELGKVHEFAGQLNTAANDNDLGSVTSISVTDGIAEVALTLTVEEKPANPGIPASNAFTELKDFLGEATLLNQGATWKAKVNGTTIVDGKCLFS